jgi:hypothetical protein
VSHSAWGELAQISRSRITKSKRPCKNRAMNPAGGDFADVIGRIMRLIRCNLLKAGNYRENPAYRLARYFLSVLTVCYKPNGRLTNCLTFSS